VPAKIDHLGFESNPFLSFFVVLPNRGATGRKWRRMGVLGSIVTTDVYKPRLNRRLLLTNNCLDSRRSRLDCVDSLGHGRKLTNSRISMPQFAVEKHAAYARAYQAARLAHSPATAPPLPLGRVHFPAAPCSC